MAGGNTQMPLLDDAIQTAPAKMPTGIAGLDYLLEGGLVRGNSLMIEGPPGSGKSTLGVRIVYEGIVQYDEPGLIVTFEEFPRQIYQESLAYGLDLRALEKAGKLRVVWTSPARVLEGFKGKNDLIEKIIGEIGVRRLVIDSITHFRRVSAAEMDLREILAGILSGLKLKGVNAFLVKELERMDEATIAFEEYLVDASLRVYNLPSPHRSGGERFLEIRKTRGQGHISGYHPLAFSKTGMAVYPNWRPQDIASFFDGQPKSPAPTPDQPDPSVPSDTSDPSDKSDRSGAPEQKPRVATGIAGLDTMLSGGLWNGSFGIVRGLSGTGKSVIGYHFIDTGLKNGEDCLLLNFEYSPPQILVQAASLGMSWDRPLASGQLRVFQHHISNLCVEEMISDLILMMKWKPVGCVLLDSIDDLGSAVKNAERLREHISLIAHLCACCGATLLMTSQTPVSAAASGATGPSHDFANMANTVIQLSMAESDGEMRRFASVWKHAGSDHAKELREFRIDGAGFHVEHKAAGLSGILTGQTQGAMKQIADQVLPALDEVARDLAAILDGAKMPKALKEKLTAVRSNVGLMDILLREHFGETQFRQLAAEIAGLEAGE